MTAEQKSSTEKKSSAQQIFTGYGTSQSLDTRKKDQYGYYVDIDVSVKKFFRAKNVTQRMRWIAPGEFLMGSPKTERERSDSETQHRVVLTQGFWLADSACTQVLWQAVMGENLSRFKGEDRPVEQISWDDCQQFIERLNEIVPEGGFRLPTEAEWEYACRAGTLTPFSFGEQMTPDQVNYNGNNPYSGGKKGLYRQETVPVKELPCNDWGFYQMHGNVWEWCQDWYGDYGTTVVEDPTGPAEGDERVLRGGSWDDYGRNVRSAVRSAYSPASRDDDIGFRLARGQTAQ